ncbi:MAG: 50S ribosomal protein L24e [Candidatus Aenigmatarchaeota archaeon]
MECSFCGKKIEKGEGKIFVKKTGESFFYCSSKCEKNHLKLGRESRNTNWVQ